MKGKRQGFLAAAAPLWPSTAHTKYRRGKSLSVKLWPWQPSLWNRQEGSISLSWAALDHQMWPARDSYNISFFLHTKHYGLGVTLCTQFSAPTERCILLGVHAHHPQDVRNTLTNASSPFMSFRMGFKWQPSMLLHVIIGIVLLLTPLELPHRAALLEKGGLSRHRSSTAPRQRSWPSPLGRVNPRPAAPPLSKVGEGRGREIRISGHAVSAPTINAGGPTMT